jgi:streptogramin lyase
MTGNAGFCSNGRVAGSGSLRRIALLALGALSAALVVAPQALAVPQVSGTFPVTGITLDSQITQGPDGNMWVTLGADATNDVARINSQTGAVTKFNLDDVNSPAGITSQGGKLWVTAINQIASFAPGSTDATATMNANIGGPRHLTVGPDGNLWTVSGANVIKIPPGAPNTASTFPVLGAGKQIVPGGDGNLWVTDGGNGATIMPSVVRVSTGGAVVGSRFNLTGSPQGIARGPGTQMAFGCPGCLPQSVGRITPPGTPQLTPTGNVDPGFGVTFGNDGAYWITQANPNNLRRLTPQGQSTFLGGFPSATNRGPRQIAKGPNNTLWVTLAPNNAMDTTGRVARVTGVTSPSPPPPPPACDNDFAFGKAKKNKKKGTAKLPVEVACAGTLELAGKGLKPSSADASGAGEVKLAVKAKGKAKKKLKKKGKAKVTAEVTFIPDGGTANTEDAKVKLKKR